MCRFDIVKSRAHTVIGLGGTDALMGFDDEMERSCDGTHVCTQLPDKSEVHSWREK